MHPKSEGPGLARVRPAGDQGWAMYYLGN